ncbi:hypothetical protein TTHERM_00895870 (macronuclear) [Tetrahymena thermophila SB210]|uniref:Zinc finger lsd1 subclass family protein n=1 Tax=Tetrahymena thermophila (strain SB210) TaxID=312017 RepID=Q22E41_TETTS|nr:hypothetical protein TTHERM_00895870 [Tetrahymena thermophila SB210]EAR83573.2 hypothetical protein TTHERM_00895870 [Tetrahymena thermophila SB210]|eukprot:XP_001031236.2 hypothetical protein TTHERM_00895870 [Tetrahymena thermophila SB210]
MQKKLSFIIQVIGWIICYLSDFVNSDCSTGTYQNELSGNCDNCYVGCSTCTGYQQKDCLDCLPTFKKIQLSNQFICSLCPQGQFYDDSASKCLNCNFDCDVNCDFGYYRNPINQLCEKCTTQVSNSTNCLVEYTYYDQNGKPTSFSVKPLICDDTYQLQYSQCTCQIGVYRDSYSCTTCTDPNCMICYSFNSCSQYNKNSYCKYFYGYDSYYGCFNSYCRPLQFKLFDPKSNSFKCVSACPIGYTANLQTFSCIQNNCTGDISQLINGTCFYRTCPSGYYFQQFQDLKTPSKCIVIDNPNCMYQLDEYPTCLFCQNSYIYNNGYCVAHCQGNDPQNDLLYYQESGKCNYCWKSYCSSSQFEYTYIINDVSYIGNNCPNNYQNVNKKCVLCSNPKMIKCDTPETTKYLCDWGENNTTPDCQKYDLTKLTQNSFDGYGNIQNYSQCYNYDPITKLLDGVDQQICAQCAPNFFNIFGSCIDDCPNQTFKNTISMACETPIQNCAQYYQQSKQPLCTTCLIGYVLYKSYPSDTCVLYSSCKNGFFYDLQQGYCNQCQANCDECLSNLKCTKPSAGYVLYNFQPVNKCPQGTYLSGNSCQNCGYLFTQILYVVQISFLINLKLSARIVIYPVLSVINQPLNVYSVLIQL